MSTKTSPQYKLPPHTLKFMEALQEEVFEQALFELIDWRAVGMKAQETYTKLEQVYQDPFE